MTADQKQRANGLLSAWRATAYALHGDRMAALLQELADGYDAPESLAATNPSQISSSAEPFGYFKAEPFGWTDCAETDDGAIALYTAPPAPSVPPVRSTGQWESSRIADYNRGWNDCREAMLAATPTPPEPPAAAIRTRGEKGQS